MIPAGIILIWHGSLETIPIGWAACDGNNGTPDLTDAFVPGAGWLYEQGDRQGDIEHTHYAFAGSHVHELAAGDDIGSGTDADSETLSGVPNLVTYPKSMLPPYKAMVYIMKL